MNLTTRYLGLELPHPFMAGAGPMADTLDGARRVEDAGACAIVMRSLFEEQIDREALATHYSVEAHAESFGEATSYFPDPVDFVMGPDEYLETLRRTKGALGIPVLASLNGYTAGGWLSHARLLEQAGADALELNLYYVATDVHESSRDIEDRSVEMVRRVRAAVGIPIAVKLSPFYTSLPHVAHRLEEAAADGLVLFNRFFETDIDVETLELRPSLRLSTSDELLLRLRWLAVLSGRLRRATLAVSGGVHTVPDAIKAIMAGASAVQVVSALLREGPGHLARLRSGLAVWMEERGYESVAQMRGSMDIIHCPDPEALTRANYMRVLQTWKPAPQG